MELIHRFLDNECTPEEIGELNALLAESQQARDLLLDISEQAIVAGDMLSVSQNAKKQIELAGSRPRSKAALALTLAACTLLTASAMTWTVLASMRPSRSVMGTIKHAHGLLDLRGHSGDPVTRIENVQQLYAGDILESKSCDSWLELDIAPQSQLTLASHSSVRMLQPTGADSQDYELLRGGLWVDTQMDKGKKVRIITPTATIEAAESTFNVRVTETETALWVHRGQATVRQAKDGQSATLQAGIELSMSLENSGALSIKPQASPTHSWSLQWPIDHRYAYGRVLNEPNDQPKLKAMPMLWPIPNRDPLLLHVAAIGAWKSSPKPIVILEGSVLRFQGRTQSPHAVRFGFSTQKVQGVFGGKFELDIQPESLAAPGQRWQVDLPLDRFRALYPQLNDSSSGLQLIDVYALTVHDDVGLEILGVELIEPAKNLK
jgi:ferric-dicitrate binding protein FerR (iron transport regulator)